MSERPVTTLDFDGVICRPPFGWNVGISRTFLDPAAEPRRANVPPRWFSAPADYLRFNFRQPLPRVREALGRLCAVRTVVVLTGRRSDPTSWLRRHEMAEYVERVVVNDTPLRSSHFKLRLITELGAREHVDDDPKTVQLLAQRSGARVYLCDWPRNRGLDYASGVTRVADLLDFARRIDEAATAERRAGSSEQA